MSDLVLDTHAVIWYLAVSPRLSATARSAIKSAVAAGNVLYVPTISLAEMVYLEEKGRISPGTLGTVAGELTRPGSVFVEAPLTTAIALSMSKVRRDLVPDLPDRIITATAVHMGLPLVTADGAIRSAGVPTIW